MSEHRHARITLSIVTAQGSLFFGTVERVVLPAEGGEMCVLPGHTPVLARLMPGEARYLSDDAWQYLYLEGGYLEVQPTQVTVLADTALRAQDIDARAAEEAVKRARSRDQRARLPYDKQLAHAELIRALALLQVALDARRPGRR
ncbi:ATP synthase F1 subunit epsilon [Acidihalobacter aeolianus]|uniref:ATP synthase epsilon chain n=2 Tax=Acidihalobacter TaxID=1765964 RepID=A0A1D8K8P5_9GAMM|nr:MULTISPECIES: ATP synthase F1 subunit epsilon [Acidihalobacter]AOV17291.1 ATP synthase F1 subunit epsilon [Acidihalobacter aeolianus]OBS10375.1 ATP synthase F1 subunit epsilon [Acidihalobacter prosperus]